MWRAHLLGHPGDVWVWGGSRGQGREDDEDVIRHGDTGRRSPNKADGPGGKVEASGWGGVKGLATGEASAGGGGGGAVRPQHPGSRFREFRAAAPRDGVPSRRGVSW